MNVVPIFAYSERQADDAWECHRALLLAEQANEALKANELFQRMRKQAFDLFQASFERVQ